MEIAGGSSRMPRIGWGVLEGDTAPSARKNARLPEHGATARAPLCRITTDGAQGIGPSRLSKDLAYQAVGLPVEALFSPEAGTQEAWMGLDYPLWDLLGPSARAGSRPTGTVLRDDLPGVPRRGGAGRVDHPSVGQSRSWSEPGHGICAVADIRGSVSACVR